MNDLDPVRNAVFLGVLVDDRDEAFFDLDSNDAFRSEFCCKYRPDAGAGTDVEETCVLVDVPLDRLVKQGIPDAIR